MKRALKKAAAFISALAVAATMAVNVSAASSAERIVKNAEYKTVIATSEGIFFANFSRDDIDNQSPSKTMLCVTPDGEKTKVKIKDPTKVCYWWIQTTGSAYCDYNNWCLDIYYGDYWDSKRLYLSNGKNIYVPQGGEYRSIYSNDEKYVCVKTDDNYILYDESGKKILTIPYSALQDASSEYIEMTDYDNSTKSALFYCYDYDNHTNQYWLVRKGKTIAKYTGDSAKFVKNSKGETAVEIYKYKENGDDTHIYYSAKTGKKIKNFNSAQNNKNGSSNYTASETGSKFNNSDTANYTVKETDKKYVVYNKKGKKIYSIDKAKVAGYKVYDESVAVITQDKNKYGLVLVK